jgi:hypothetical protein
MGLPESRHHRPYGTAKNLENPYQIIVKGHLTSNSYAFEKRSRGGDHARVPIGMDKETVDGSNKRRTKRSNSQRNFRRLADFRISIKVPQNLRGKPAHA